MATKITKLRASKHITQQELADVSCISKSYISLLEKGRRKVTVNVATKIAPVLGVQWYELIDAPMFSPSNALDCSVDDLIERKEDHTQP